MKEEKQTINGIETTVLVGDDVDERTESESRVGPETTTVMGGLNDESSNLMSLKEKSDSGSTQTKARKTTSNKSAESV